MARLGDNIFVGKHKRQIPLGRPRHTLEDNIKMELKEINGSVQVGLIWLRIGTRGGSL